MTDDDYRLELSVKPAFGFELYFNESQELVIKQCVDQEDRHIYLNADEVRELCRNLPSFYCVMAKKRGYSHA